jgi:hypothetical protein
VKMREDYNGLDIFVTSICFELQAVSVKIVDREWANKSIFFRSRRGFSHNI